MNYWIADLASKAAGTRAKYQEYFQRFCAFAGKTPNELIEQRHRDLKKDDPREQRGIEYLLKSYMVKLRDDGMSSATQQIAFAAVKSFFESNEYPLRTKRSDYPKGESLGSRSITKQTIREILDDKKTMKDKRKTRAIVLFLKDTGLRVSDLRNLNYGHVADGLEKGLKFIPLQLVTQKAKTVAKTFIGPEAIEALNDYLEERRRGTQRLEPETITRSSPLFRTNQQGPVKRMSRSGLSSMVRWQVTKHGATKLSAHSFRKFLQTNLDAAGISPNFTDQIIGHKLINSRDAYSLPTDEMLLKAYTEAYPLIRIYPDRTEVEERVSKLETQITEKNVVIADLVTNGAKKTSEVEDMKVKIANLENQLNVMVTMMTAIYQGKGERVEVKNLPPGVEEIAYRFSDEDTAKIHGVPLEKIRNKQGLTKEEVKAAIEKIKRLEDE